MNGRRACIPVRQEGARRLISGYRAYLSYEDGRPMVIARATHRTVADARSWIRVLLNADPHAELWMDDRRIRLRVSLPQIASDSLLCLPEVHDLD